MFSQRLSSLRKEHKKTQQNIADFLGITRPAYTAYESGKREPDFDTLQKLANFFDVSTDYLLGRTDIRNQEGASEKGEMYFFDKENVSEEEIKEAIAYIKARRLMNKQDKDQ